MTQQEIISKVAEAFAATEMTANSFSEEQFFAKPASGKWSAAEQTQHLFRSVKPLAGLFGKTDMMLQFGLCGRPRMDYAEVIDLYLEKLKTFATSGINNTVDGLSPTKKEQIGNLHAINTKFLERAATLPENILDEYQIPHPLIGLITIREWLYFTHYHTLHHKRVMDGLK